MREGNNLRFHRAQRRVTCSCFFVTISSRHSSRRMRFGRSHSPTQNSHRTRFFHLSFLIQISISNERVHRSCQTTMEDRNLFQIHHVESVFLSNTSRFGFTWPTFHAVVTPFFLTRKRPHAAPHMWLVLQTYRCCEILNITIYIYEYNIL